MSVWSKGEHELLLHLLVSGMTAGAAAKKMLKTRNAVLGHIFRNADLQKVVDANKKPARKSSRRGTGTSPEPAAPVQVRPPALVVSRPAPVVRYVAPPMPAPRRPDMRLVPLTQVGRKHCRFPAAEDFATVGHFLFCGAPVAHDDATYCAFHLALCITGTLRQEKRR